jgi:hypothetical protein
MPVVLRVIEVKNARGRTAAKPKDTTVAPAGSSDSSGRHGQEDTCRDYDKDVKGRFHPDFGQDT